MGESDPPCHLEHAAPHQFLVAKVAGCTGKPDVFTNHAGKLEHKGGAVVRGDVEQVHVSSIA